MSNPILSGFSGIGDTIAQKAAPFFQSFQNSVSPNVKPTNTNTFSFDFAGGLMKGIQALTQPFMKVTDPKAAAGAQIIGAAGDAASAVLRQGANSVIDWLKDANKKNDISVTTGTTASNPVPSQNTGFSLSDVLTLLSGGKSVAAPVSTDYVAQEAARNAQNSIIIVGGIALLLAFMAATGKGK